jgi:hypothetical protein
LLLCDLIYTLLSISESPSLIGKHLTEQSHALLDRVRRKKQSCGCTKICLEDFQNECVRCSSGSPAEPGSPPTKPKPLEPPLPAKIKPEEALKFGESLLRGEPNRKKIALTAISDKVRELI